MQIKRLCYDIPPCEHCTNTSNLFCSLTKNEKAYIGKSKKSNFYKKGQVIFYEGNHANGLFCIYRGKVKLSKLGENGKNQIIRFAKEGEVLGYRALLSNDPYHATAVAMEECCVCLLSKEHFMELLRKNFSLAWDAIQLLTRDLKNAEQHLIDVAQKTVRERICETLVLLKNTFDYDEGTTTISAALTRSEIADIAGTTTETVIRTLAILNREKLIEFDGKKIIILNLSKLLFEAGIHD
ncbi:MAG: Crp/Fnr family transcriptional regulator [Bacteroidia bacterium]